VTIPLVILLIFLLQDGLAVNVVLLCSTITYTLVMHYVWNLAWWKIIVFPICFCFIEGCFLLANIFKVPDGAWIALVFGIVWTLIFLCWYLGTRLLVSDLKKIPAIGHQQALEAIESLNDIEANHSKEGNSPRDSLEPESEAQEKKDSKQSGNKLFHQKGSLEMMSSNPDLVRLPMTIIFVSSTVTGIPASFRYFRAASNAIPEQVIFLYVRLLPVPKISVENRIVVIKDGPITRLICRFGFAEKLNVVEAVENSHNRDEYLSVGCKPAYYFGHESVEVTNKHNILLRIPLHIFGFLLRNSTTLAQELVVPPDRVLDIGLHVRM